MAMVQPIVDIHVNDALINEMNILREKINIYVEALEWIEDHNVAAWDHNGKPISPSSVAMSAREKARQVK